MSIVDPYIQDPYYGRNGCMYPFLSIIVILILLLCSSCRTKEIITEVPVEVPHYIHDTLRVVQKEKETIHVTDSMWLSGDTVFKYRDRWREYAVHDTVRQVSRDTISLPVYLTKTEFKEVEKPLSLWQSTRLFVGTIAIFAILGILIWIIVKRFVL